MPQTVIPQTLFIDNLPSQTTDTELATIIARHGRVLKASIRTKADNKRRQAVSGVVELHPDDFEHVSWVMAGSWYKNKCLDVRTSLGQREPRERSIYTAHRY